MLNSYRQRMAALGGYEGEAKRRNAQNIMDASWMRDPATRPVYVKWVDSGLPSIDDYDVPVYAKYNVKSYHNITGDAVAYLLQFRLEDMRDNPDIKVGSYVQIMNEMDEAEWWLIVHYDDRPQFRQFSILKCTWTYKWVAVIDGKRTIYSCLGAPRKQNSYNSGVWLDYTAQTVENQEVMWLPTNNDTKTILYDTKFLKSSYGRYPALKWTVTKIEDTAVAGISMFTMAQTQFDPAKDNCDEMIADYWDGDVGPDDPAEEDKPDVSVFEIVYSGSPIIKAGGGYKKLTLKLRNGDNLVDVDDEVVWSVPDSGANGEIVEFITEADSDIKTGDPYTVIGNPCKIRCVNDYRLIGRQLKVVATCAKRSTHIILEVAGL